MADETNTMGTVFTSDETRKIHLIGITGQKQNGKNTICNILLSKIDNVVIHSFADPIREISKIFGFTLEEMNIKKEEVNSFWGISWRKFAQLVGTEMFRCMFRYDVWVKIAEQRYLKEKDKIVIFDDVRFENEAEFIKTYNGIIIKVIRPTHQVAVSKFPIITWFKSLFLHESERPISNDLVDYEIINDGTQEDLKNKILKLINILMEDKPVQEIKYTQPELEFKS